MTNRVSNLFETIASAPLDPAVGIRVALLTGGEEFSLFGAEIAAGKRVGAHYHDSGLETYQIIEGSGTMHLGSPAQEGAVDWHTTMRVSRGDSFTVEPGEVHQLVNDGATRLVAVFGCPKTHLSTDRTMVRGFGE
jgi:quercetin dioxygenase-like cupin family protein